MIKNERQFRITSARVARLERLEDELSERIEAKDGNPARLELELQAVRGEIGKMQSELTEYSDLESGRAAIGLPKSVDDIPRILIRARIAAGLTQEDLAARLGLKQQQIQRYEATNYQGASLSRVAEIAEALGVRLTERQAI